MRYKAKVVVQILFMIMACKECSQPLPCFDHVIDLTCSSPQHERGKFLWPYFFTFIFRKVPRIWSRVRPFDINFAIIQKLARVTLITLSNKYGDKIFASKLFPINVIVRLILPTFYDKKKSHAALVEEFLKATGS